MQNDEIKKNKRKLRKKKLSLSRLTQPTCHWRYETRIEQKAQEPII